LHLNEPVKRLLCPSLYEAVLILKKYVRISNTRDNGFVEFDFAIGDTLVYVELMQSLSDAFKAYCARNKVTFRIAR
jgi:phenol hydroxylase P0 protein